MTYAATPYAHADYAERPALFARLRRSFADHRVYRASHKALNALTDRQLADIGFSRPGLREFALAAAYSDQGHLPQRPRSAAESTR